MFIGGDSLFGGVFRLRVLTVVFFVVAVLVSVSVAVDLAFAQDPDDAASEPGYTILPGEEGYVEVPETSPDGVEGEAEHECDDDPQAAECPPSPPTGLSLSRRRASLYLTYSFSGWRGSNTHWYRFELQRSGTRSGTYTFYANVWGRRSPAYVGNVGRGKWYKLRAQRCRTFSTSDCGDWTSFTAPLEVPELPMPATSLSAKREGQTLTASYTSPGSSSKDQIEVEGRRIVGSGKIEYRAVNGSSGYARLVTRGYEYRFRVKRCTDDAREDCIAWTAWSGWAPVPELPPKAYDLNPSRSAATFTASYKGRGPSHDEIDVDGRRTVGTGNIDYRPVNGSSGYARSVTRGYEYRFRVKRCTDADREDCGGWSVWSDWEPVPRIPVVATELSLERSIRTLTTSYKAPGSSDDVMNTARRSIGSTGSGSSSDSNIDGSGHSLRGSRGSEYRFRVKRCTDADRDDCGGWSAWSDWEPVPRIPVVATELSLDRSIRTLTTSYTAPGSSDDVMNTARRSIGSTGSGSSSDSNIDGSGHSLRGSRGSEYRFRVKRCTDADRDDCGGWSAWSDWEPVPRIPVVATELSLERSIRTLTTSYKAPGSSDDVMNTARRSIGSTGSGSSSDSNIDGSGHSLRGSRGSEYRFRVMRCTDDDRDDCGGWSAWSDWEPVPRLGAPATNPTLTRSGARLTATYSSSGDSYDKIDIDRRSIDSSSSGGRYDDLNISGSGYRRTVTRNYEYRFRIKRCTDDDREDCSAWSAWSGWEPVPNLPDEPGKPTITVSGDDLTVSYDDDGDSHDQLRFTSSDAEDGTFRRYSGGTLSGKVLSGVATGRWYKASARRCTDTAHTDCTSWSEYSDAVEVSSGLPAEPGKPKLERSQDDLTVKYVNTGASYDQFRFKVWDTEDEEYDAYTGGSLSGNVLSNVDRGERYVVSVRRCADKDHANCTEWSVDSDPLEVPLLPGKPAKPSLTVSEDDLTVGYTAVTGTYPKFSFTNSSAKSGRYVDYDYDDESLAGAKLSGVTTGKWYKVTLQLCTDSKLTDCSVSSDESDVAGVPHGKPGTPSMTVSDDDLTVVYTTIAGTHDQFGFESSPSSGGSYKGYTGGTLSGTKRSDVARGAWYKVRVRRCLDSQHTVCSDWSGYSSGVVVLPERPGKPTLTVSEDDLTVSYTVGDGFSSKDDYEFTSNDEESGDYTAYTGGMLSGATRTGVATGMWYKVRLRRCLEATHVNCSAWSVYSDAKEVPEVARFPALVAPTIGSRADGVSVLASFTLVSGYDYELELRSSEDEKRYNRVSLVKPKSNVSSHTFTGLSNVSDHHIESRVRACVTGSTTDCGGWITSNIITLSKAPAPTVTGITVANEDDLTIAYTLPVWQHGTGTVYDFKIRRGDSSSSAFTSDYTDATIPSGQPHKFNDVHTGYYYKALARRCSDTAKTICGDWSGVQSGVNVPALSAVPAPTNIRVSAVSHVEVKASFTASSWPGQIFHRYVFELGKSSTKTGTFVYSRSKTNFANDEVRFDGVETGKWYKIRAKRCYADRKRCSVWVVSDDPVKTPAPDPKIEITGSPEELTINAGLSENVSASATGLDATASYKVKFEAKTESGVATELLRLSRCDSTGMDAPVELSLAKGLSGSKSIDVYGCHDGQSSLDGSFKVLVLLLRDGVIVAKDEQEVKVKEVPKPTHLRADGDNRGIRPEWIFQVTWEDEGSPTSWELRYRAVCDGSDDFCTERSSTWVDPVTGITSRPHTHFGTNSHPVLINQLYRVEVLAVKNGARSAWSEAVYVYPSTMVTTRDVATMRMYGHQDDGIYNYRFCDNTVPKFKKVDGMGYVALTDEDRARFVEEIVAGFDSWSARVNWSSAIHGEARTYVGATRDVSKMMSGKDDCPPYTLTSYTVNHLSPYGVSLSPMGILNYPEPEVRFVTRLVLTARCRAYQASTIACAPLSSRLSSWPLLVLLRNNPIPYDADVLFDETVNWKVEAEQDANKCSKLRRFATHEVGHSLGVSAHHAQLDDSIMTETLSDNHCVPHPYDIVAMLTNYQTIRME